MSKMAVLSSSNSQIDVTSFLNNSTQTVIAVHNDIISIFMGSILTTTTTTKNTLNLQTKT